MTTERIVGPLREAIRSLVDLAATRDATTRDAAMRDPTPTPQAAGVEPPAPPRLDDAPDLPPPIPVAEEPANRRALGLPPPSVGLSAGRIDAATAAAMLQAVARAFLDAAADAAAEADGATAELRETAEAGDAAPRETVVDVRGTGEIRQTLMVKGVPQTTDVVAGDDRPRQPPRPESFEARHDRAAADEPVQDERAPAPPSNPTPEAQATRPAAAGGVAAAPIDPQWVESLAAALASADATTASAGGILPSAILNAAMLPGWPPPRPLEGLAARGASGGELAAMRREDQIAALLEALGVELGTAATATTDRRVQWRWLRRVALLLSGIMVLVTTLADELAEIGEEERDRTEGLGTAANRRGTARRIYLD